MEGGRYDGRIQVAEVRANALCVRWIKKEQDAAVNALLQGGCSVRVRGELLEVRSNPLREGVGSLK